jgi:hypothetical protein
VLGGWHQQGDNSVDFGKMLSEVAQPAPLEPTEIYAALPNKAPGYGYLRYVQGQVLEQWFDRRDQRDLLIKVNTGGGKTIDGLIILQSYLNADEGPALYVAPDRYLALQVRKEAAKLGIPTVDDPDSPQYLRGEAIAVVNAYKLFNGKSVFSSSRPGGAPAPIGSVVIDDAHAALATTRTQMAITIPRTSNVYSKLLEMFEEDLEAHAPNDLLDVKQQAFDAIARVPFWAWRMKLARARTVMHAEVQKLQKERSDDDLVFAWPIVSDTLEVCRLVFTSQELTITPPCPNVRFISNFIKARHRVYLSATLSDDSVLVSELAADPASISNPITPKGAGDIGERMILAPQESNPDITSEEMRTAAREFADEYNVVVLVPSDKASKTWAGVADRRPSAAGVQAVVNELKSGHVGLVVLANKYDGIDLPGDACRVLIIDGLPESFSGDDRLESQLRTRETGIDARHVQRVEQGMGRGVRSNEDHCVVLLMGPRLSQLIADPRTRKLFSLATQAQLELSGRVGSGLTGKSLREIMKVTKQALDRDSSWVKLAKVAISDVASAPPSSTTVAKVRRAAFDAVMDGSASHAADLLTNLIRTIGDDHERGWLEEQLAVVTDTFDPVGAQNVLARARTHNKAVLRPVSGIAHKRIALSQSQAQKCQEFFAGRYSNVADMRLGFEAILSDLVWDPMRTKEFEAALLSLAEHLGFAGYRPEQEFGEGPDDIWALGGLHFWVIEAKSGAETSFIAKRDVEQLGGSINWFRQKYDHTSQPVPVMFHPSRILHREATQVPGMQIVDNEGLNRLKAAVRSFALGLASTWNVDGRDVESLLAGQRLRASDLGAYTTSPRRAR